MDNTSARQRFVAGLSATREAVDALGEAQNIDFMTRFEMSEATKALYAFVATGDSAFLYTGDERLRRVLAMAPLTVQREITPMAERMLDAATWLTLQDRQELVGEWSRLFGSSSIPAGMRKGEWASTVGPEEFEDEIDLARDILRRVPAGLERWLWSPPGKAKGGGRWHVDDEFHVQSLLWLALAPALPGLTYEESLPSYGRTRPRVDLALPASRLAIEVKFVRRSADFARATEQFAADSALYTSDYDPARYSRMIAVTWDQTRSTERYDGFVAGLKAMRGVIDAFVIPRPGRMGAPETSRAGKS